MPFEKGRAKTGGRTKGGTKVTREVMAICEANSHNPIQALIDAARDKKTRPDLRARCNMYLADKYIPSLRAITLSGPGGGPISVETHDVSASELVKRGIARIIERRRESGNPQPTN